MESTRTGRSFAADVARLAADEPAWLRAARHDALAAYEAAGLPDRARHLWRYTDPAKLLPGDRPLAEPGTEFGELPPDYHDGTFEKVAALVLVRDGRLLRSALDPEVADAGLLVADLRAAATQHEALVRPHLFALAQAQLEKFEALSAALFTGGDFVRVPAGLALNRPVRIAHRVGAAGLLASRSLVVVGDGAQAEIVYDLASADARGDALLHAGAEVHVGAGARLRLVFIQTAGSAFVHAPVIRCRLARDAALETVTVALGGGLVKSLQATEIAGRGASSRALGIVFGDGRRHFDHHTVQDHVVGHNESDLDYRTVLAGRARSAYTGNLRIGLEGAGASAHQRNHNLLLSESARADTIPELEILTNDVACSHAAAVGPIDEEQVFFCTSRGLDPATARRVIVAGFLEPVIARIPGEELQQRIRGVLTSRLEAVT